MTNDEATEIAATKFSEFWHWCFSRPIRNEKAFRRALRKFVVAAHVISPNLILNEEKRPMSLRELAELPAVNSSDQSLRNIASNFRKRFGFQLPLERAS